MRSSRPTLIAIDQDDYHAEYVGRTKDGRQFFLTTPFEPATAGKEGAEFVALYVFDRAGGLLEARIESCGPRATMDQSRRKSTHEAFLASLGKVSYGRIEVAPFSVERFGTVFGLVARAPEEADDPWAVEVRPGDYMAFFAPWDSGEYDT